MGNTLSIQDKVFSFTRLGDYHQLKALLDQLQRNSVEFRRNPSPFLDIQDADGNTPLLVACIRGHYQVAELLLQRGASIQIQNNRSDGGSPLHEAIYRRHEHIIGLLLRFRAEPFVENCKSFTPMDFACQTKNVELLRRLEVQAPWKGWLELKVPAVMGLSTEWKRRWVVICHRIPSPFAPANRRRTHVSLLCYKSTTETTPDCRVWLDGARAIEVTDNPRANARTNGRTPAQMELKLHRSHSAPSGCSATGNAREGFSLHFRPDEGTFAGCNDLRTWAEIVNNRGTPVQGVAAPMAPAPSTGLIPPIATPTSGGVVTPSHPPEHYPVPGPPQPLPLRPVVNPQFSPLSLGVSGGLSGTIVAPPPNAGAPGGGSTQHAARPAASPPATHADGNEQYPSIQFHNPLQHAGGSASPPSTSHPPPSFYPPPPPLPSAGDATASTMPSAPIASFTPFGNLNARPPAPAAAVVPAGAAAGRVVGQDADDDDITGSRVVNECCVCLSKNPTHGFVHGNTVHQNICGDCVPTFQASDDKCPICRVKYQAIVRIYAQ